MTQPDPEPADRLPRHTTPTSWEVELPIRGVAVLAMLHTWFPHFDHTGTDAIESGRYDDQRNPA